VSRAGPALAGSNPGAPRGGAPRRLCARRSHNNFSVLSGSVLARGNGRRPAANSRRRRRQEAARRGFWVLVRRHRAPPLPVAQLHALLLISGALLPDPKCPRAPPGYPPPSPPLPHPPEAAHLLSPCSPVGAHSLPSFLESASAAADGSIACSLVSAYGRTGDPVGVARKVFD
jgi:hypothetical protein